MARSFFVTGVGFAAFAITGCQRFEPGGSSSGPVIEADRPIVNGILETGFPNIGALVIKTPGLYGGAFCTGSLIAPNWVLTAGHCVTGPEIEQEGISAQNTMFFLGNDSTPLQNGSAPAGAYYDVDQFIPNPNYDPSYGDNDIALVHLSQAVPGSVTPAPIGTTSLSGSVGVTLTYIGYGATEGKGPSGDGPKRSTTFPITSVQQSEYTSAYNGHGTCFGDSGGPGLMKVGETWTVVGVTSRGTACQGGNCDPCQTPTISTRVDSFAIWINQKLGAPPPSCLANADLCDCADACQPNGSCDNTTCHVASCGEAYQCMAAQTCTTPTCQQACMDSAAPDQAPLLNTMLTCFDDHCANAATDAAFTACVQQYCQGDVDACFPTATGDKACQDVYSCLGGCAQNDNACWQGCYETGTATAQAQVDDLLGCLNDNCKNITDDAAFQTCASQHCQAPIDTCFPSQSGDQTCAQVDSCMSACAQGDQPCLQACFGTGTHAAQVAYNALVQCANDKCGNEPEATYNSCIQTQCGGELNACIPGSATCTDNDHDGSCVPVDCNDNANGVHPNATELCGNHVDDNCDGQTDEGCATGCTDNDDDGACVPQDCNDDDATIKPNGTERCGDSVDNDCDGQTDENCSTCVDDDHDGYCAANDCDDSNAGRNAGVIESCGDGVDNNCDGQTDENCSTGNPDPGGNGSDTTDTTGGTTPPATGGKSSGCEGGAGSGLALGLVGLGLAFRRRRA